ncbi:hypothetical protein CYMTET_17403 [Cymbomonas tetramitiformis]|uniref:Uncharacterized protein n=1 Tax=Cymbomonas tetramitiformis TaxID=36881 RepID=A0AAE0L705_9CHLO|nr:hypothetical protein CYMTET_17403 [Cymbomonas tetramitiformis]
MIDVNIQSNVSFKRREHAFDFNRKFARTVPTLDPTNKTFGSFLGSSTFAAFAFYSPEVLKEGYPEFFNSEAWKSAERFYLDYGLSAAFLGAAGRFVRHLLMCWATAKAPNFSVKKFFFKSSKQAQ